MNYRDILLVSEETIKTYTNINDNISGDYLLPAIAIAQRCGLEGVLGTALVRKLQELIGKDEIHNEDNKMYSELLDEYVTDYLCYAAIVELIPIVSFKINNVGTIITEAEKVNTVTFDEVFKLKDFYEDKADYFAMRMQRFLIDNHCEFDELNDTTIANIKANLYSAAGCNIWLGGQRGKK